MFEHSKTNSAAKNTATDRTSNHKRPEEMTAMQGSATGLKTSGLSMVNVLQMHRVIGNQAVQRMLSPTYRADKPVIQRNPDAVAAPSPALAATEEAPISVPVSAGPAPGPVVPVAPAAPAAQSLPGPAAPDAAGGIAAPAVAGPVAEGPAGAAPLGAAPAPPKARQERKDLNNYSNYNVVYKWLKARADTEKKNALFGFFDDLTAGQKMSAIKTMCNNERSPTIEKVKDTMLTGVFTKTVDWDRFSEISREAKAKNIKNYNADGSRDYASYTAIGTSATAGGVSGSATISSGLGAGGALSVANSVAPAAGVLSGLASVSQIYNASQNYDSSLSAVDKAQLAGTEASGGVADLTRFSAGTVNSVRTLGNMATSGAATIAAGTAGVVGGAAYLAGGVAGYIESGKNQKNLNKLENKFNTRAEADQHQRDLGLAAHLGGSTQGMNKNKSATTAAKGALMIAGGAVLLAAAASPVGPILLAAAAIIGGIGALIKFYKKSKRKETFVDKALNLDKEVAKPENAGLKKEQVRQKMLEAQGFNNVDQCYTQLVTDLASMLYEGGVVGQDEECQSVIESLGLKVDKAKRKPGKDLIAKKLHT
ncbi:hypothetical protein [Paenibacillus radicis (ex Xue et al. 2023)]|uniref:Uncharacterized protein n=1 Tax=Paenibacillus radicis (ex Xue et al. 2023) TaxID=2972489 RepID=A0ABT1YDV6_9BACL|nr:hypothetical protein [Paenibacillus radicis (ex Xue et al. 2023)]MCR8630403.1 hypothetical protein [Paenibacillus radicis (ex Xue et al. 2023)]